MNTCVFCKYGEGCTAIQRFAAGIADEDDWIHARRRHTIVTGESCGKHSTSLILSQGFPYQLQLPNVPHINAIVPSGTELIVGPAYKGGRGNRATMRQLTTLLGVAIGHITTDYQ